MDWAVVIKMVRHAAPLLCLASLLAVYYAAVGLADDQPSSRVVFVGIPPQAFLVNGIAGQLVDVEVLLSPGQSPHTFEPSAKQMIRLAKADLYFSIGLPFERALTKHYAHALANLRMVDTRAELHLLTMNDSSDEENNALSSESTDTIDIDPHVWLSPQNMKSMARTMTDSLCAVYPSLAASFRIGLNHVLAQLDSTDTEVHALLGPYRGRQMYVFHPAYGYFAHAYGLEQIAIEHEGKEPSAHRLAELLDAVRDQPVAALCVQPEFTANEVTNMAAELHTSVLVLDPLARDYCANLVSMAKQLAATYAKVPGH